MLDRRSLNVYVVTSTGLAPGRGHLEVALAAIGGGATAVQLRAPELDDADLLPLAKELAARCRGARVLFVVNDRLGVALAGGADGVHLGQGDNLDRARDRIGEGVLGISVNDVTQARAAEAAGADYLGVTVWSTRTKPEASPRGLSGLRAIVRATSLPVVGIGGIHAANAGQVIAAGAAGVAVVSTVALAIDPVGVTKELAAAVRSAAPKREGSS